MRITFRSISKKDFPFLKSVYRSSREQELEANGWTEKQKDEFIEFQFNAQHSFYTNSYDGADFMIIEVNKSDVGRLYIWRTENQIRIMDIALLPEYRRKGTGTKILKNLIKESEQTGKKLNIHVEYYNPALKLYENLGFKKTDDTGVYYFMERFPESKT